VACIAPVAEKGLQVRVRRGSAVGEQEGPCGFCEPLRQVYRREEGQKERSESIGKKKNDRRVL